MGNIIPLVVKVAPATGASWVERGACRTSELGPDAWFPEVGKSRSALALAAQQTCRRECPVAVECLLYALGAGERHGIWGGMTARQRTQFAREVRERRARREARRRTAA
jgi:WhiB family redox-sensing transcriptional regulator